MIDDFALTDRKIISADQNEFFRHFFVGVQTRPGKLEIRVEKFGANHLVAIGKNEQVEIITEFDDKSASARRPKFPTLPAFAEANPTAKEM